MEHFENHIDFMTAADGVWDLVPLDDGVSRFFFNYSCVYLTYLTEAGKYRLLVSTSAFISHFAVGADVSDDQAHIHCKS